MSEKADFHVTTYGERPSDPPGEPFGTGPSGGGPGGGGLPLPKFMRPWDWWDKSPTYPTNSAAPPENPSPVEPYTPPEAQGPPLSGAGGGAGALGNMSQKDLIALIMALISAGGGALSKKNSGDYTPTTGTDDPNFQSLIARQNKRMDMADPVYQSVLAMANGLLPTQYQRENPFLNGGGSGVPTSGTMPPTEPLTQEPPMATRRGY